MYENNSFITLTYSEENLKSPKLQYEDFQAFVKKLRTQRFSELLNKIFPNLDQKTQRKLWNQFSKERKEELYGPQRIGIFVTGEYGDRNKRPHWHALVFNWRPDDCVYKYSNDRGDKVFDSKYLSDLWPHGIAELGSITFESAGYCARYAAKKLAHGNDGDHEYEPVSKKSSRSAIGKAFLERYWRDIFTLGKVVLSDGSQSSIPRYYEKWLQKHQPEAFARYVTQTKNKIVQEAIAKEEKISLEEKKINMQRSALKGLQTTRNKARKKILEQKFEQLQERLKL